MPIAKICLTMSNEVNSIENITCFGVFELFFVIVFIFIHAVVTVFLFFVVIICIVHLIIRPTQQPADG